MAKEVFIPNWYIDRKTQVKNKKIKGVIGILILLNILIGIYILNISTKIRGISKDISQRKDSQIGIISNNESAKQQGLIIEKYKEITEYFEKNNLNYNNLFMNKDDLELDIQVKSYGEYINVIKCIENKYSIKNLVLLTKNEEEYTFKVIF